MPELKPILPDPERHLRAMGQLAADAFSNGQYVDAFCDNYIGNSNYDWNVSRLVFDGDLLAHHWGVWGYEMRLESVLLKVGGVGAVVTHPDYRKQGLMHLAAQESFTAMTAAGYDLSILRGRHYVKMSYARAWNYVHYNINPEHFPVSEPVPVYQPLTPADIPVMDALYNQTHANFNGTAVRPTFLNKHAEDICAYAWRAANGQVEGYVRALADEEAPKTLLCVEAVGDPQTCLAVLYDLQRRGMYDRLACFTLPHLHPLLQYLRRGNLIIENRYFEVSGWRVRIINLESTLRKLVPLFELRLAASRFADWQGCLLLDSGEQRAALHINHGKVKITPPVETEHTLRGGAQIARLLIGADDPEEIIREDAMECQGLAEPLTRALFPNLRPMLSHWDEF